MDEDFIDYFEMFWLDKNSTEEDLDFRYLEIIKFLNPESYPDRHYTIEEIESAVDKMSVVNEGYRTLKDPVLREEYRKKYVAHMKAKRQQEKGKPTQKRKSKNNQQKHL